ncbi:hypothetical protein G6F57_016144 [Rhizopus arrhizus]|nr:hypothetical protein G6F57_016144 [Rhizopus arrhizus]
MARAQAERAGQRLRCIGGRGERGRYVDHHHRVVLVVGQQRFDGRGVAVTVGIDHDVDRIAARPALRQHRVALLDGAVGQVGQRAPQCDQLVHREAADTAAVAEDGQSAAGEGAQPAQRLGGGEQFVQRTDAQQAGAVERRAVDIVGARKCLHVGIAAARLHAFGAARLHHHHWLGTGGGARGRHELARVLDLLDIEQDGASAVVGGEVIEQIAEVDIHRVAQRDHGRESDRARHAPFHQCGGNGRGFGDQREVAGLREMRGDAGVEPCMRRDHAQAVRAKDAQAMRARHRLHLRRQRAGAFAQVRGEDDRRLHATFGRGAHHLRHDRRRRGDHHQVRHPVQVLQPFDRADAIDLGMPRSLINL